MEIRFCQNNFRSDLDDFFEESGIMNGEERTHHPPIVFNQIDDNVIQIEILKYPEHLMKYPDDTNVIMQWAGKWRSDFFQFKAIDYKNKRKEKNEENI